MTTARIQEDYLDIKRIEMKNVGPIRSADIHFGDLTVIVGPQATGKSIFLQSLKLAADQESIQAELQRFNIDWQKKSDVFLDLYFGEGMSSIWSANSEFYVNGKSHPLKDYAKPAYRAGRDESIFFIPAQRVVSLRNGQTQNFNEFRYGDPFTIRAFSEKVHQLVQNEFGHEPALFPRKNRLSAALRGPISEHIFGGGQLAIETKEYSKRVVLKVGNFERSLPFLAWSAGQREFTPLLLGLYWLCPAAATKRNGLKWAIIEELEMGLHPQAISTVMALILELLARDYKVCISTHSPHVLDVVWALQFLQKNGGRDKDVRALFGLAAGAAASSISNAALNKALKVYYFQRDGEVKDISSLDPGSADSGEAGWGGLSEFSGRVAHIVGQVARRNERVAAQ